MDTSEILDTVKVRLELPSDYALAQYLGISHQAVGYLRKKNGQFRDETAVKVAEALGRDPGAFLVELYAARSKSPAVRRAWSSVMEKAGVVLISLVVGLSAATVGVDSAAAAAAVSGLGIAHNIYCGLPVTTPIPQKKLPVFAFCPLVSCLQRPRPISA